MAWVSDRQERRDATILLAEDDATVRKMVAEILQLEDYEVVTACDGEEAFETFRREAERIDLIITDIVMPKMNGKELGRKCRARAPTMKILYMSGFVNTPLTAEEDLAGAADFIPKPFHPGDFLDRVRKLLEENDETTEDSRLLTS